MTKRLLKIPVFSFMAGILLFTAQAEAASPTDYVGMDNLCKYYLERLDSQSRIISADLAYVKDAIAKIGNPLEKAEKLRLACKRCRERLARKELDVCTVVFGGKNISVDEAEARAKELESKAKMCKKCKDEAVSDERQLSSRLREIGTIANDLKEWKRENDEAVYAQLKTFAEIAFGELVDYFSNQAGSAKAFKGWYTRYKRQLENDGVDVNLALVKLQEAYGKYASAQVTAFIGKNLEKADMFTMYDIFVNTVSKVALIESETNGEVKELLKDPNVGKYLNQDKPGRDLAETLVDIGAEKILKNKRLWGLVGKKTARLVPAVQIATLVRDSGYNGLGWWLSLKAVVTRYELSEKSGRAVQALHNLIERRKAKWAPCL